MLKRSAFLLFTCLSLNTYKAGEETIFKLGDAICKIQVHHRKEPVAKVIVLHDDENTGVEAFQTLPGCRFILHEVQQEGRRLLKYTLEGSNYYFDPNRIFTGEGIRKTVTEYNTSFPPELISGIRSFSDTLLDILHPRDGFTHIVAVHNNTEDGLSISSYINSPDAAEVYISDTEDTDDFFLVTQLADFTFFKEKNRNVVLQSASVRDDGSLSVYCGKQNIPYINIEAQHGHTGQQIEMLSLCQDLLSKSAPVHDD